MAIYASMNLPSMTEPYLKPHEFHSAMRALADETRIAIVELLGSVGPMFCGDICRKIPRLTQATVSHHLKQLEEANLVKVGRFGQKRVYDVEPVIIDWFLRDIRAKLKPPPITHRRRYKKSY